MARTRTNGRVNAYRTVEVHPTLHKALHKYAIDEDNSIRDQLNILLGRELKRIGAIDQVPEVIEPSR